MDSDCVRSSPSPRAPHDLAAARIGNGRTSSWLGRNGQPANRYFVHSVCPRPYSIELRNLQKRMATRHLRPENWSGAQSTARENRESMDGGDTGCGSRYVSLSLCIEIQRAAWGNATRIFNELADV